MHSDTLLIIASSKDRYILSICNCMHYRCAEVKYALVFEKQWRLSLGINYRAVLQQKVVLRKVHSWGPDVVCLVDI